MAAKHAAAPHAGLSIHRCILGKHGDRSRYQILPCDAGVTHKDGQNSADLFRAASEMAGRDPLVTRSDSLEAIVDMRRCSGTRYALYLSGTRTYATNDV